MTDQEVITLKEYIETRLAALECLNKARLEGLAEARILQAKEYERRLENLNNEAARIKDIQGVSVTKELYESQMHVITGRVRDLELSKAELQGKANQSSVVTATMISVAGLILAAVGIILSVTR